MRYWQIVRLSETREGVLATLVARQGHAYKPAGACAWYPPRADEPAWGNLGSTCVDAEIARVADAVVADGRARYVTVDASGEHDALVGSGTACGGRMTIRVERLDAASARRFAALRDRLDADEAVRVRHARPDGTTFEETVEPPVPLVVFGATPLARRLVERLDDVDVRITVSDWRSERLERLERFAAGAGLSVRTCDAAFPVGCRTRVAVVSHHAERDAHAVERALAGGAAWVGLLASRARRDALRAMLRDRGVSDAALRRVASPIGLPIGARSDAEIAIAIAAQLVRQLREER